MYVLITATASAITVRSFLNPEEEKGGAEAAPATGAFQLGLLVRWQYHFSIVRYDRVSTKMSLSLVADYASDDDDAGQNGALSEDSADEAEREEQERIAAVRVAQERRARARAAVEAQRALQSALPPPDSLFSEVSGSIVR